MQEDEKYVRRAKRIEARINAYSLRAESFVNSLSDNSIHFIDQLLKTKTKGKKKGGLSPPFPLA